eukprot:1142589-Pelagomonas_calceolata.AAC.6
MAWTWNCPTLGIRWMSAQWCFRLSGEKYSHMLSSVFAHFIEGLCMLVPAESRFFTLALATVPVHAITGCWLTAPHSGIHVVVLLVANLNP